MPENRSAYFVITLGRPLGATESSCRSLIAWISQPSKIVAFYSIYWYAMNSMIATNCATEHETYQFGARLARGLFSGGIVAIEGVLGSGKTLLTRGIAAGLGINDHIVSPTFTIIQEYRLPPSNLTMNAANAIFYHIDLYRIDTQQEALLLDLEPCLFGDGICVIEWPSVIDSILPSSSIRLSIEILSPIARSIHHPPLS